jgi:hypothetical protein
MSKGQVVALYCHVNTILWARWTDSRERRLSHYVDVCYTYPFHGCKINPSLPSILPSVNVSDKMAVVGNIVLNKMWSYLRDVISEQGTQIYGKFFFLFCPMIICFYLFVYFYLFIHMCVHCLYYNPNWFISTWPLHYFPVTFQNWPLLF